MDREKQIELLMMDGCTRKEAEKHLQNGATVFDDFAERFDAYMQEWDIEDIEPYRNMIDSKNPLPDWGVVEDDDKVYYIQYVL